MISERDVELWKLRHPLFKHKIGIKLSLEIQHGELGEREELMYLKEGLMDLSNLVTDIQVGANDLLMALLLRLYMKRFKELKAKYE